MLSPPVAESRGIFLPKPRNESDSVILRYDGSVKRISLKFWAGARHCTDRFSHRWGLTDVKQKHKKTMSSSSPIAHFKYNSLAKKFPDLADIIEDANDTLVKYRLSFARLVGIFRVSL